MMTGDASLVADTSHELVAPMLGDPEPLFPRYAFLYTQILVGQGPCVDQAAAEQLR